MIKAILFDMDGVLVDAKDWHYHTLNIALEKYNHFISIEDHINRFDGLPTAVKLEILTKELGLDPQLHATINDLKQKHTLDFFEKKCCIDPQQIKMLRKLSAKYKICLCSNSKRKTIQTFLEKSGTEKFFQFYLSNEDIKKPKPNPEIYSKAIKKLNLDPKECLIIEDNFNGIKAAKKSGAHVLEIKEIIEVNYNNISDRIQEIQKEANGE